MNTRKMPIRKKLSLDHKENKIRADKMSNKSDLNYQPFLHQTIKIKND